MWGKSRFVFLVMDRKGRVGKGRERLPLQHPLQSRRTHILALGNLVHDADQVGKTLAALVRQDAGHRDLVHFGFQVVQFDETGGGVFACEGAQGVFDDLADFGLEKMQGFVRLCAFREGGKGGW